MNEAAALRERYLANAAATAETLLRRLALKTAGFSGADIERLVREARAMARREQRPLSWTDLERLLEAGRPKITDGLRRRAAIHEAGHAIVGHLLGIGRIRSVGIAVTSNEAGHVWSEETTADEQVEPRLMARLAVLLAGRAAERVILGTVSAGAGGDHDSDLAQATKLAADIETVLGLARTRPLLHRRIEPFMLLGGQAKGLVRRIDRRLRRAERQACRIVRENRDAVIDLAARLLEVEVLEGEDLHRLLPEREGRGGSVP
ncbi:ATP-dependent Zn protease [Oricola thermophila]|uniref:ATP-dependent Zn protease n=1 Tax=Oricola thermophila TaxID=2742145 RepID=A0A6N1VGN6_9HYPH|nr:ATP-dependent Zn protease [Oricola thermophila]QKV20051.1 ATP-dependent Zn protease [Oricola thermophila]